MSNDARPRPLRVAMPLYEDVTLVDFAGATQVFAFAGGRFDVLWLAREDQPILTSEGVRVLPHDTWEDWDFEKRPIDVLFVPGGGGRGVAAAMRCESLRRFLRSATALARLAGAVCVGAFPAAAAGMLDGCRVTTYWSQLDNLRLFPRLEVVDGYPRWQFDGNRFTGGGVSSSFDLALEIVNRLEGPKLASTAQLAIQYAPDPPMRSGDPSTAPPELVETLRSAQRVKFLDPIAEATREIVEQG